jgi:hypothetical protein
MKNLNGRPLAESSSSGRRGRVKIPSVVVQIS